MFFYREGLPFYILFYPLLLDYDVSLHDLLKVVVVIPTSPRTSKTEFETQVMSVLVLLFLQFLQRAVVPTQSPVLLGARYYRATTG